MYSETPPVPPPPIDAVTSVEYSKMTNFTVPLDPYAFFQAMGARQNAIESSVSLTNQGRKK